MSALLLALLHDSLSTPAMGRPLLGEGSSGNVLLDGLNAVQGPALDNLRAELQITFRHLLSINAAFSLLGLGAALAMPNQVLRGREDKAT